MIWDYSNIRTIFDKQYFLLFGKIKDDRAQINHYNNPMRLKYAEDYHIRVLLKKVKLHEVMTTPVVFVNVRSPFRDVVNILHQRRIRHLPVVNSEMEVVGIISQRDLYKLQPPHKNEEGVWIYDMDVMDGFILDKAMTPNPFTLSRHSLLAEAILPMVTQKYGCIPIIDESKKLCGIITQYDILKIAFEILQEGQ